MILSPSNKYHVVIENDDNGEKTTYELYNSSNYKTVQEKNKYEIIKIIRTEDNYIIHEYKQLNSSEEYQEKLNSLGGAFYNANKNNMKQEVKQETKQDNKNFEGMTELKNNIQKGAHLEQDQNSDNKINIVKSNIVEKKIDNINKEEYYNAMFTEK